MKKQKSTDYIKKYKICVSGSAAFDNCAPDRCLPGHCTPSAKELAKEVGRQIVKQGAILLTGATTGIPYWAAVGANEANGISIGFSPASTEKEHVKVYRLPTDMYDVIVYTGFNYAGRNLLLTRASDAVIIICGRMGTLNEFTVAFEDKKPVGVLEGSGGTADKIDYLLKGGYRGKKKVIASRYPEVLVREIIKMITLEKENNHAPRRVHGREPNVVHGHKGKGRKK